MIKKHHNQDQNFNKIINRLPTAESTDYLKNYALHFNVL